METNWSDIAFGTLALSLAIAGLFMLFQGMGAMNKKNDRD